jgi:hypothetical protein
MKDNTHGSSKYMKTTFEQAQVARQKSGKSKVDPVKNLQTE